MMILSSLATLLSSFLLLSSSSPSRLVDAFVVASSQQSTTRYSVSSSLTSSSSSSSSSTSTSLHAIGVLARKAKEAELRKYVEAGVEDAVMEKYNLLKENLDKIDDDLSTTPGPLQTQLTKRPGTITVIAEYKAPQNKNNNDDSSDGGSTIMEQYDPEILSPMFREFGASGIAVSCLPGGDNHDDLRAFVQEQRRASNDVPGPVPVINNDLMVDELQVAQTAAHGAAACVVTLQVLGDDKELLQRLLQAAQALQVEPIVAVRSHEEAQTAIDAGARMILVSSGSVDEKIKVVENLDMPQGQQVCTIANVYTTTSTSSNKNDKQQQQQQQQQLNEIEQAWALRDSGLFNCVWVGDALYSSSDQTDTPGAIIKTMKSKSSLKWASPKASSGRGEGAREYLGDILM